MPHEEGQAGARRGGGGQAISNRFRVLGRAERTPSSGNIEWQKISPMHETRRTPPALHPPARID